MKCKGEFRAARIAIGLALATSSVCACSSKAAHDGDGVDAGTPTAGSTGAMSGSGGQASKPAAVGNSGAGGSAGTHAPGSGGMSGGTPGGSGGSGGAAAVDKDAGAGDAAAPPSGDTGTLPAIDDPAMPGHYTMVETENVGPNGDYTTFAPMELGEGGVKHPILIWGPGAGSWPAIYQTLLTHIATHGFVIVSYNSTPQGPELLTAIDWIVGESTRDGSPYFNKVDTTKIAMGGQSAGSLGTFVVANDPRLTTTVHINGGTFDPHAEVMNIVHPALFVCGDDPAVTGGDGTEVSDIARPNCDYDFEHVNAPVWYGDVIGASHTTVIDNPLSDMTAAQNPLMKHFLAATVGWLRWQLADDLVMKALFVGPDCGFCTQKMVWTVQQKDLK